MFIVILSSLVVGSMFALDYLIDGEKLFHYVAVERKQTTCPFTTVEAFVMSH